MVMVMNLYSAFSIYIFKFQFQFKFKFKFYSNLRFTRNRSMVEIGHQLIQAPLSVH